MDALPYVDTLFKEYLLFRGFTNTLEIFNKDLANDPGCGFQAERITELIFRKLVPGLDCQQLVEFLEFLNMGLYSRLDSRYESLVSTVEADLLRLFLVTAHSAKRPDKIAEFFKLYGPQILSNSSSSSSSSRSGPEGCTDWREWFLLPYLQHPEREQRFQVYFSTEWSALLEISFRNFLSGVMRCLPLPAVLRFNTDRRLRLALQQQVHMLQDELDKCRKQLDTLTAQVHHEQQQQQPQQQAAQQQQHIQQHYTLRQSDHIPQQALQQQQQEHHQQPFYIESSPHAAAAAAAIGQADQVPHPLLHGLHRRDLSLDSWQQQQQRKSGPGTSRLQPSRRSSTGSAAAAAADHDGQELQVVHQGHPRFQIGTPDHDGDHDGQDHMRSEIRPEGSGLFELLPTTAAQPSLRSSAAGAAAAAAGEDQLFAVAHRAIAGSPAHQQRHSRTSSLSGAISFEPSPAEQQQPEDADQAAAAAPADAASGTVQQQQQQPAGGLSAALTAAAAANTPAAPSLAVSVPTAPAAAADAADATPGSSAAPSPQSSRRSSSSAATAAALSTSPVMSWAMGMQVSSSAAGLRSRHSSHGSAAAGSSINTAAAAWDDRGVASPGSDLAAAAAAAVVPLVLLPVEPDRQVSIAECPPVGINPNSSSITCVAFSPSGSNIATAYSDGSVTIWTLPAVQGNSVQGNTAQGNSARRASFACGTPVRSLSWDPRADKLMLIGCSAGGGVRAWHADTKRIMADVGAEPGFPHVAAVAACPAEPIFAVAANSRHVALLGSDTAMSALGTASSGGSSSSSSSNSSVLGRLVLYNSRSFKRSAVLSVPGDVALVSLAYSSNGSQLVVGTAAGAALLYEPASRVTPMRVWHVAAAVHLSSSSTAGPAHQPVQVLWRSDPAAAGQAPAGSSSSSSSSSPSSSQPTANNIGSGFVLTLCSGVLCEWAVSGSSRAPVAAVDVIAAAAAIQGPEGFEAQQSTRALQHQTEHDQRAQGPGSGDDSSSVDHITNSTVNDRSIWSCSFTLSGDGKSCAVLCATVSAGALLLYKLDGFSSNEAGSCVWQPPQALVAGSSVAGGGTVAWHPFVDKIVVGQGAGHLMVSLDQQ